MARFCVSFINHRAIAALLLISVTHKSGLSAVGAHVIFAINISDLKFLNAPSINTTPSKIERACDQTSLFIRRTAKHVSYSRLYFPTSKRADYPPAKSRHIIFILLPFQYILLIFGFFQPQQRDRKSEDTNK